MSHELRTPLTAVRAEAELALRHERTRESYQEALQRVLAGADQMERIIDTLLIVAREEAGSRHGTANAREAALRAAKSCADMAASKGIKIEVARADPPARVATDSELVERILVPVIENACRYGRTRVTITSARDNGNVVYTVGDDGPGVTEAETEEIFEPGVRGSAGRLDGVGGAGLGLALARRLSRAARGDLEAKPSEQGGRFTVVLPSV
jgi:signal transduction histidine kinase